MIKVRMVLLAIGITTLVFAARTPSASALSMEAAEKATEKFLARIATQDLDGLADQLGEDELFGTIDRGVWSQNLESIKQVYVILGEDSPIHGFRKLGQKNLGGSIVSKRYAIMFAKQPMLVDIWLYKPDKEWQFYNINFAFGTNAVGTLRRWFDGTD